MERRKFLSNTLAGGVLAGSGAGLTVSSCATPEEYRQNVRIQDKATYDILLKGGHVIDPANSINGKMDVAIAERKIALVGKDIPAGDTKRTIDVSGLYVTPGLIDMHIHAFFSLNMFGPGSSVGIDPVVADTVCLSSGVTTCVDAGTSGADNFEVFKELIDQSRTRILAFVNISRSGMDASGRPRDRHSQEPSDFKVDLAVDIAKKYPDTIVGYKVCHYKTTGTLDEAHPPWAAVDAAEEAGRLANLPVMFHNEPRPPSDGFPARSFRELVLEKMRPGDIHTHCYGYAYPIMLGDFPPDKVNPDVFKARERGVIFDVGHGAGSFTFRHAVPAIEQGYLADSISADIYCGSYPSVVSMNNVMSKFLNIGMTLEDVIRRTTVNPAHIISHPELGTLSVGSAADIAVLELQQGDFGYYDSQRGKIRGDKRLQAVMTLLGGQVIFDLNAMDKTILEDIPKDDRYWKNSNDQTW